MNCQGHCNGKCKLLGGLEQKIMNVLWSANAPIKPSQVLAQIKGDYAYTTVMTVLKRMSDKKLVSRQLKGNTYLYTPVKGREEFATECLEDLFIRLFDAYGEFAVPSFKKVASSLGQKI